MNKRLNELEKFLNNQGEILEFSGMMLVDSLNNLGKENLFIKMPGASVILENITIEDRSKLRLDTPSSLKDSAKNVVLIRADIYKIGYDPINAKVELKKDSGLTNYNISELNIRQERVYKF